MDGAGDYCDVIRLVHLPGAASAVQVCTGNSVCWGLPSIVLASECARSADSGPHQARRQHRVQSTPKRDVP
eukprot:7977635-Pyramimonas_sp.AAC.1